MSSQVEFKKAEAARKINRKIASLNRLSASHIPDSFKTGDDEQEDLTAPPKGGGGRDGRFQYMHKSVFSMIAAAGSKSDFHSRFDDSSDSEDATAEDLPRDRTQSNERSSDLGGDAALLKQTDETSDRDKMPLRHIEEERGRGYHRTRFSEHNVLKPIQRLPQRNSQGKEKPSWIELSGRREQEGAYLTDPPKQNVTSREAPVLSRMIEAQARFDTSQSPSGAAKQPGDTRQRHSRTDSSPATLLSSRLMEIFGFEKPEKVISEYRCWLLQSMLLQGYMYVTERHICFYAYLPKKSHSVVKSGYLSKRGRQNPKYHRYWFTLKGDVLSYYLEPSNLYFPRGHVDLRYGISAHLSEQKDKGQDVKDFTIATDNRTYYFRADSAANASEWVKALKKVIFRSHNDGDSIKISLPIENVIDVEENPVLDFAETFKIRVVESGETYAIDEYFFSFFECGKDAINVLKVLVNDTPAQQIPHADVTPSGAAGGRGRSGEKSRSHARSLDSTSPRHTPALTQEQAKATLKPHSPRESGSGSPRRSGDLSISGAEMGRNLGERWSREYGRASFAQGRKSESTSRLSFEKSQAEKSSPGKLHSSSDSFVQSFEPGTESSALLHSSTGTAESASQILNRSDVFRSPTIRRLQRTPSDPKEDGRRRSQDTARSISMPTKMQVADHPAGRSGEIHEQVSESENEPANQRSEYSTLQDLVKAGSYPLQRAAGFAEYLKSRSKRMSSLLASESMGYIEKVSGMWTGGQKHYSEGEGIISEDRVVDPEDEEQGCGHGDRFRAHFALPATEKLQATYFGYLHRVLPLYGKLYISSRKFCFRSLLPGTRTKMVLPLKDVENVEKEKGFRFGYHGLVVVISGHEELFFEFNTADARDDCAVTLHQSLESIRYLVESDLLVQQDNEDADVAMAEHRMLQEASLEGTKEEGSPTQSYTNQLSQDATPILFDDPRASIVNFKPSESLKITCLTIGSRGDVQPYIALCKGLLAEGHRPRIATHREFEPWVRKHGIDFAPVEGDPAELMRICVENGMFTYSFLKEASMKFRGWIDDLLSSAWESCQGSDILIESPSAMAGIHIAEALRIPYFRAFTMPWTRTRAYPHAFAVPERKMGGAYNYITYVMFDNFFWKAIAGQINRWRKGELGLRNTNLDKMQPNKVPFLYNFSPSVVPPPLDYSDWIRVTGYWFLNEASSWTPPNDLVAFITQARNDHKKIVYIGFGSIVVSDPAALTKTIMESVLRADVRCILSKGWSDRLGDPARTKSEIPLPSDIYQITSAPHDWLFSQIDAVAHHGGAGTTGASLRAGVPTIIKPFFGDQFFFGSRVEDLGVGICMKRLNVTAFSRALREATRSERMIVKAKLLGEQIRKEDGVANAIQAIYRDLEYAKTLVRQRSNASVTPPGAAASDLDARFLDPNADDDLVAIEETWTFVDDDKEIDLAGQDKDGEKDYDLRINVGAAGTLHARISDIVKDDLAR